VIKEYLTKNVPGKPSEDSVLPDLFGYSDFTFVVINGPTGKM
jgi:hypothetical protein